MTGEHLTQVNYHDRLFDQGLTSQYSLSIRIDPGGLSFSVYSPLAARFIVLESVTLGNTSEFKSTDASYALFSDHLHNYIASHEWLLKPFKHTCLIVTGLTYTLVPHVLYNAAKKSEYLEFVSRHNGNDIVKEQFLNSAEAWMVFYLNKSIFGISEQYFSSARLMNHAGAMIETILPRYRHNETQNPVFVNIRQGSFEIIVLKEGRLRYCNSFHWKENEDLVYFLIFVLDQLSLNPENVTVMLMGSIEYASTLFELLQRYIRHVDFIQGVAQSKSGMILPLTNEHKYYDLLNPGLCG